MPLLISPLASYMPTSPPPNVQAVKTRPAAVTPPMAPVNSSSLRIALLGYRSHPHVGGQGIYLHYLSKALVELGHQVDVLSGPPYPDLDPRVGLIRIPSLDLYAADNHVTALRWQDCRSLTNIIEWWTMLTGGFGEPYTFGRRVVRYLRRHPQRYDIIHDNQSLCTGLLTLQRQGWPVVSTLHHPITRDRDLALEAESRWGMRLLIKRWYSFLGMQQKVVSKLNHIVTVSAQSQSDIHYAFGRPPEQTPVIYNGIDCQQFSPQPHINRHCYQLITTASADQPLKGLRYLLEALHQVRDEFPRLTLIVIGKLNAEGDTAKLLTQLKLSDHVQFQSGISTQALVEEYARATIAIVPSLYEGFGLPAGEAMACEVPLIATTGGALPEITGDAAYCIEPGNSNQLANAIRELLHNNEQRQRLGQLGRQRIIKHFSWQVAATAFVEYYRSMLSNNNANNISNNR